MARRLPPLNALRAFEASARLGSFVAAAGELRVSAAAVSQQVRRLEQYLDTTLFQRLARGLVLSCRPASTCWANPRRVCAPSAPTACWR
jgi:LysR family glycine cleavage system transcriptional activator